MTSRPTSRTPDFRMVRNLTTKMVNAVKDEVFTPSEFVLALEALQKVAKDTAVEESRYGSA